MGRLTWTLVLFGVLTGTGCEHSRQSRRPALEPAIELRKTSIDYVDTDGFDALLEVALVNRDPVIVVRTPNSKPDWTGRLNGWIAAWNMGKQPGTRPSIFRGQIPVATIDGDTLREFRLLVSAVVDRAEDASKASVTWWKEERIRARRVDLLRPYSLRFHICDEGQIHVIFFHGDYARQHPQFVATLNCDEQTEWSRRMDCSHFKKTPAVAITFQEEAR